MTKNSHLRVRDGREHKATTLELFFDLVFVFAITQIAHFQLKHLDPAGVAKSAFLLLVMWWLWNYTTWMTNSFDPEHSKPVRLVLIGVMGLTLMMSIVLPYAFSSRSLIFAGCYAGAQILRNAFTVWGVTAGSQAHRNYLRIFWWSVAAGGMFIAGALVGGDALVPIWCAALAIDYLGPLARYWTPFLGRAEYEEWDVDGGHFAERFHLLIIIALGESIVITGATTDAGDLAAKALAGMVMAFLTTAAMWWLYFNFIAERARQRLQASDNPGQLARNAFTYLHLPIVAGIILTAVADEMLLAHPEDPYKIPIVAVAGPVLYLIGHNLFRLSMARSISMNRLIAAFVLLTLIPVAEVASALVVATLVLIVLVALIIREERITVTPLEPAKPTTH